jgi:hypothetical protein
VPFFDWCGEHWGSPEVFQQIFIGASPSVVMLKKKRITPNFDHFGDISAGTPDILKKSAV